MEHVCTRLSKWKSPLPQVSYRDRVLMVNNLVASALWHRLSVLPPPGGLSQETQRTIVDFFWSRQHWLRSAILYLPVQQGGQGPGDIASRVTAFRLQTAQRLQDSFQPTMEQTRPACCWGELDDPAMINASSCFGLSASN